MPPDSLSFSFQLPGLRDALAESFDESELRSLCLDLGIDWEEIGGATKTEKIVGLLTHLERRQRLSNLFEIVKQQRPHVEWDAFLTADDAAAEPPFKGLRFFDVEDAPLFFGRDRLTADLHAWLADHNFLAVVGASGSGKSSVVRASLVPHIKKDHPGRVVHIITPGAHPLESLATSLTLDAESVTAAATLMDDLRHEPRSLHLYSRRLVSDPERLLLVVDQFEELFTLCRDRAERQAFVNNLLTAVSPEAAGPVSVVITLRADFYNHCLAYEGLIERLEQDQKIVPIMSGTEFRRAIEGPAEAGGLSLEPGLVDLMIRDIGAGEGRQPEPGALPLLSHALLETWRRRQGKRMTLAGYTAAGGVQGAIAQTADTVYRQRLSRGEQAIARNIFLRLTEPGEGTVDTRRRVDMAELIPSAPETDRVSGVLKILADARLVTTSAGTAEVAHEALIREWPVLRGWLDENREALGLQRRLTEAAAEWAAHDRDPSYLYSGARLAAVAEWDQAPPVALNVQEQAFLAASVAEQERRLQAAAAQRRQEEQLRAEQQTAARLRRLRNALGVAAILLVVAALFAWGQRSQAVTERNNSATQEALAVEQRGTAEAASTLAVEQQAAAQAESSRAIEAEATARAAQAEAEAARNETERLNRFIRAEELAAKAALVPDDHPIRSLLLAVEAVGVTTGAGEARVPAAEQALRDRLRQVGGLPLTGHREGFVRRLAFSHDDRWLATVSGNNVRLWSMADPAADPIILRHEDVVGALAISHDDQWLAITSREDSFGGFDTIFLWSLVDPTADPIVLSGHEGTVSSLAFSHDDRWLASASFDNTARLWSLADSTAEPFVLSGHGDWLRTVAFSHDDKWLATASLDNTARLWSLADPTADPIVLTGHDGDVFSLAFSHDDQWLATAGSDNTARLWSVANPTADPTVFAGHEDDINSLAFSRDDRWLATASADSTARLWPLANLDTDPDPIILSGHEGTVSSLAFSDDNQWLATTSDNAARLWSLAKPGSTPIVLRGHGRAVQSLAFSHDGRWLATAGDRTARLWPLSSPTLDQIVLTGHTADVVSLDFSHDDQWLATASWDARLWSVNDLAADPIILRGHDAGVTSLAFSADDSWLATASFDNTARLWSLADPAATPVVLAGHELDVTSLAFSHDGQWLATASADNTARLWSLADPTADPTVYAGHEDDILSLAISHDDQWLATASLDQTARLWSLVDPNAEPIVLLGHQGFVTSLAFSHSNQWLATGTSNRAVHLWSLNDLSAPAFILRGHNGWVLSLAFSSDDSWLAAAGDSDVVRLWSLANLTADPVTLLGHSGDETSFAFSQDGRWLATADGEGTIRLWSMADLTADPITLGAHSGVAILAFSHDGHWLATAGEDNTARLWPMLVDDLVALACGTAGRNLSAAEWDQYFPGEDYRLTCSQWPSGAGSGQ